MRSDGFIALDDLLARPKLIKLGATLEKVQEVVEKDAKTRFTLRTEPDGLYWIRANQGHSIVVEDLELTEITDPDLYPTVLHGTYRTVYPAIRASGGLKRMKRTHIHLATGKFGEEGVRSGVRKSCDLFIHIDLAAAMRDGIKFFVSSNGVILTTGVDGLLSDKYFSKIESTEQLESSVSALSIDSPLSQTGQTTRSKRRRLFGGCLSTLLPDNLLDASDFRQIPDSQEVFLHPDRQERSIVIDLTESIEGPAADDGVAVVTEHFNLLGRENEAQDIEISRSMAVVPTDLDARQWVTAILQGTQTVSKFNRGERQGERIVMTIGLVRLPKVQTDVLITHHSSAAAGTGGGDDMDETYAVVRDAVQHFQVDDWKLFPEEAEPGYEVWA